MKSVINYLDLIVLYGMAEFNVRHKSSFTTPPQPPIIDKTYDIQKLDLNETQCLNIICM